MRKLLKNEYNRDNPKVFYFLGQTIKCSPNIIIIIITIIVIIIIVVVVVIIILKSFPSLFLFNTSNTKLHYINNFNLARKMPEIYGYF